MIRNRLIADLVEFTGHSESQVRADMERAAGMSEQKWRSGQRDRFYEDHKYYVHELTHWHTNFPYRMQWTEQIVAFASKMGLRKALDFGCGIATDGLSLAELGMDVHLLEVGREQRRYISWKIAKYGLDNAKLWGKPDNDYDLAILCDVIGHVDDPIDVIKTLARCSRYVFYTEDFDIGVPAYPMHLPKPVNFDRVFNACFRRLSGNFVESRINRPKFMIVPTLKQFSGQEGGVKRHVEALYHHLPEHGIDIVEADPDFANVHAMSHHPRQLVHTNHGFYPWNQKDQIAVGANYHLKTNISLCQKTICVSKLAPSEFESRLNVTPEIIPNGIDPDLFRGVPRGHFALAWGIQKPYFLWSKLTVDGVCDPSPAQRLSEKLPRQQFVFTKTRGKVANNVKVVGTLTYPQMLEAINDCTVYLATTTENFSVQTLEAMAAGKPVLCFNKGGNAEAVVHKVTGYVATDEDDLYKGAMYCLQHAERLGLAGRARVRELYDWNVVTARIAKVFKTAISEYIDRESSGPLISVVIPSYNHGKYIGECIESVLGQTLQDFEVIVVDDNSTDDTAAIVARYAPRVRYIKHTRNLKAAAARNTGISQASGKYITCIDADDKIRPQFLERLSGVLESDWSIGIAYPEFELFGDQKGVVKGHEYSFEHLLHGNLMPYCSMFRREAWVRAGGYKDINPSWEDYEFWITLGNLGYYGKYVPEPLLLYRKVNNQGRDHESQSLATKLRGIVNSYHPDLYPTKVSVIIPCYNHAEYLKDSIGSVLKQTYQDFEIIVVDDGSKDPKACEKAVEEIGDARVRLIRHPVNKGLAEARNTGVRASKGDFILPLDADDMIKPEFLAKTMALLEERPDVAIAYTDIELFGLADGTYEMPEYDFDLLLKKNIMVCTSLYRRQVFDAVGGYDPRMNIAWEDYLFWIRAGKIGYCGCRINEPLFRYRRDRHSMIIQAQERITEVRNQLYSLEPELFKEGKKPVGCCGRRYGTAYRAPRPVGLKSAAPGVGDMSLVELRYSGDLKLMPVHGLVTGTYYEFSRSESKYVDPRDAEKMLETGMFEVVTHAAV
jgi:glycosyltransferase involved in cell wall biosynthesis